MDKWIYMILGVGIAIYLIFFTSFAKDVGGALAKTFGDVANTTGKVTETDFMGDMK